jgi:HK97 family phage prohead protease
MTTVNRIEQDETDGYIGKDAEGNDLVVFYASRFTGDKPDVVGDVVDPDSFNSWLRKFKANHANRLPICVDHEWSPEGIVGWAGPDDITVDTKGLLVAAHLDGSPRSKRVAELVRNGTFRGGSFAFEVAREKKQRGYNLLLEFADVFEATLCMKGAESSAGTVSAASVGKRVSPATAATVRGRLAKSIAAKKETVCPRCGEPLAFIKTPTGYGYAYAIHCGQLLFDAEDTKGLTYEHLEVERDRIMLEREVAEARRLGKRDGYIERELDATDRLLARAKQEELRAQARLMVEELDEVLQRDGSKSRTGDEIIVTLPENPYV